MTGAPSVALPLLLPLFPTSLASDQTNEKGGSAGRTAKVHTIDWLIQKSFRRHGNVLEQGI